MNNPDAAQPKPARKPAKVAKDKVTPSAARKAARLKDITRLHKKAKPKIRAVPPLACNISVVKPFSSIQALPKSSGEYHKAPRMKQAIAATNTAGKLMSSGFMLIEN